VFNLPSLDAEHEVVNKGRRTAREWDAMRSAPTPRKKRRMPNITANPTTSPPEQDAPRAADSVTSSRHRMWAVAAVAAAIVTTAAVGAGVYWIVHQATTRHRAAWSFHGSVHLVYVKLSAGDVQLVNDAGPVRLRSTARYLFSKPRITTSLNDGVLTVRSKCGKSWLRDCSTNLRLTVPRTTMVDAQTDHGDITTKGLVSDRIRAETTQGQVRLFLANDPGLIVARSHRGNVTIHLPRAAYVVDASAEFGQTHIGIPHDKPAPRTIDATADHGEVSIQANQAARGDD
jgi:hypothetical protein